MKLMLKNKILFTVFAIFLSACSSNVEQSTKQGGQDSGGGNTTTASLKNVEFYFDSLILIPPKALLHLVINSDRFDDIRVKNILDRVRHIFESQATQTKSNFEKVALSFYEKSPILLQDAACSSVDKKHATASIRALEIGSPICVSKKELMRIPSESLEREIIALLIHEYLHALGFEEREAQLIQHAFLKNYKKIYPAGIGKVFIDKNYPEDLLVIMKSDTEFPSFSMEKKIKFEVGKTFVVEEWVDICVNPKNLLSLANDIEIYHDSLIATYASDMTLYSNVIQNELSLKTSRISKLIEALSNDYDEYFAHCVSVEKTVYTDEMNSKIQRMTNILQEIEDITKDTHLKAMKFN